MDGCVPGRVGLLVHSAFVNDAARLKVLVVEDEPDLLKIITESLEADGFAVAQSGSAADAIERLRSFAYDGLVTDLRLPDADGMTVLDEALTRYPAITAVVITGFGGVEEAVQALKRGAVDFLIKPFQLVQLVQVLKTAISERHLRQENAELRAQLHDRWRFDNIVGGSRPMKQLFSTLELVSPMNSTVLILGETGTGKELIARTIHYNSPRRDQPFVAFSAAAIPEGLAEAELFGHTRGAFTGAINARVGRFELANKGTLFIDEVSSMPGALQAKLLRALQEREVEPIGTAKSIKVDVRVVAATNVDLATMVKDGTFREDLYYRLNVVRVVLPPLRARPEDIPMLAQHFVARACQSNKLQPRTLSQEALRLLMSSPWPGNVRQLENALEHAVVMSGSSLDIDVPVAARGDSPASRRGRAACRFLAIPDEGLDFSALMAQIERDLIVRGLEKTGGNKRQAARLLNLSRTTLIDKAQRLGDYRRRCGRRSERGLVPPGFRTVVRKHGGRRGSKVPERAGVLGFRTAPGGSRLSPGQVCPSKSRSSAPSALNDLDYRSAIGSVSTNAAPAGWRSRPASASRRPSPPPSAQPRGHSLTARHYRRAGRCARAGRREPPDRCQRPPASRAADRRPINPERDRGARPSPPRPARRSARGW